MKSKFVPIVKGLATKLFIWGCLLCSLPSLMNGQLIHLPTSSILSSCDLEVSTTSFSQTCDGAEVCIQIAGGTPPYHIRFLNDNTNPTPTEELDVCFQNLEPGNYTLKVEDEEECIAELKIEVPAVDYYIPADEQHISCHGAADGAIDLQIEIDLTPLYFSWEGPNGFTADTEDIEGLEAGIYSVSISTTDDACVGIGAWVIREPDPITIDVRLEQPECGPPDGCVYVSGGTAPYYIWVFDQVPDLYAEHTNGSITDWSDLDPTLGIPYDPTTTDGPAFCAEDVANGVYYIFVVDLHFCYQWKRVEIDANPGFDRVVEVDSGACNDPDGGSICFKIDGGEGPFATTVYPSITDEAIIGNDGCFEGLQPGVYELRTVDANGCALVERFEIRPNGAVEAKFEFNGNACTDGIGGCLTVRGGEQPYRIFAWYWPTAPFAEPQITIADNGEPLADGGLANRDIPFGPATSPNDYRRCVDNLVPGYYVIVVIDANGCWDVIRMQTPAGTGLQLRTQVQDARCYGSADGSIELEIQGGVPPYAIALSSNEYRIIDGNRIRFDELTAGTYRIKVEDRQGCSARTEVVVGQPTEIQANFEITTPSCSDGVDGCLTVYGGTHPYNIWVWRWNSAIDVEPHVVFDDAGNPRIDGAEPTDQMNFGPNTTNVYRRCAEDIPAGHYLVLVLDANRCYKLIRVHIPPAGELHLRTEAQAASCHGGADGKIYLKIEGGAPPYSLELSNGDVYTTEENQFVFEGLSAGNYVIKVTSATDCEGKTEVYVPAADGLEARFEIISPPCSETVDGCLFVEGGTRPYRLFVWTWDPILTVEPEVVFDADGNPRIEVAQPTDLMRFDPNTNDLNAFCARDIPAGHYLVLVLDANRCYDLLRVNIPPANGLQIEYGVEPASCNGEADGRIKMKINGGVPPYTLVRWDGVSELLDGDEAQFEGLTAGVYPITVIDQNECTAMIEAVVPGGEGLATSLDFDPYGSYACIEVLNGTEPYSYAWYDLATSDLVGTENCVEDLSPSTYWVEVKDAAGCNSTDVFFIDEPVCRGGRAIVNPRAIRSGSSTTFYLEDYYGDQIQWQFRTRDMDWLSIPGANSATYHTPPLYAGSDRIVQVRAEIICANGDVVYSTTAEFKIYGHVFISQLPVGLLQDQRLFDPERVQAALAILSPVTEQFEVQVFPTVSADLVNIRFPEQLNQPAMLRLSDSMGQLIRRAQLSDQLSELQLDGLSAGVYFIQLEYNAKVETHRVIVP